MDSAVFPIIAIVVFIGVWIYARLGRISAGTILIVASSTGVLCGVMLTVVATLPLAREAQQTVVAYSSAIVFGSVAGLVSGLTFGFFLAATQNERLCLESFTQLSGMQFTTRTLLVIVTALAVLLAARRSTLPIWQLLLIGLLGIAIATIIRRRYGSGRIVSNTIGVSTVLTMYVLSLGPASFLLTDGWFGSCRPAVVAFYRPLMQAGTSQVFRGCYDRYVGAWLNLTPAEMRGWTNGMLAENQRILPEKRAP